MLEEAAVRDDRFNIVLVNPEIPPNTGSVARLCGATMSTLHLVRPLGFKTDDRHLRRAGLDYWRHVDIVYWDGLDEFLAAADDNRLKLFSKTAPTPYTRARFRRGDCLLFGRETKGLPPDLLAAHPGRTYSIPMANPNIRSLNLAMSCGIVLYEALRQTSFPPGDFPG